MAKNNKAHRLRFSKEEDELLISEVSKEPALFDAKHKSYKDQVVRDSIWGEISAIVEKTVEECKKRWKSLKDVYWKKKKEYKNLGPGAAASAWDHMEALAFLESIESYRKVVITHSPAVNDICYIQKTPIKTEIEETIVHTEETLHSRDTKRKRCEYDDVIERKKRRTSSEEIPDVTKRSEDPTNCFEKVDFPHPVRLFFSSMAETVMTFPPALAARAKMNVLKIITDLELENCGATPSEHNCSTGKISINSYPPNTE